VIERGEFATKGVLVIRQIRPDLEIEVTSHEIVSLLVQVLVGEFAIACPQKKLAGRCLSRFQSFEILWQFLDMDRPGQTRQKGPTLRTFPCASPRHPPVSPSGNHCRSARMHRHIS
jgi:hypothetical protein